MDFSRQPRSGLIMFLFIFLILNYFAECSSQHEVNNIRDKVAGIRRLLEKGMLKPEDYTDPVPNNKHDPQFPNFEKRSK